MFRDTIGKFVKNHTINPVGGGLLVAVLHLFNPVVIL